MEAPSSPSSTITAPPDYHETAWRLAKLIAEAMTCHFALLHYDSTSKSMVEWWWPIDGDGKKILPFNLEIHRKEYELKYPCCLCANGSGRSAYIEFTTQCGAIGSKPISLCLRSTQKGKLVQQRSSNERQRCCLAADAKRGKAAGARVGMKRWLIAEGMGKCGCSADGSDDVKRNGNGHGVDGKWIWIANSYSLIMYHWVGWIWTDGAKHRLMKREKARLCMGAGMLRPSWESSGRLSSKSTGSEIMNDEEQRVLPIQLEWTYKERSELLNRLDSCVGNGITSRDFQILFSQCKKCKRVRVSTQRPQPVNSMFNIFNARRTINKAIGYAVVVNGHQKWPFLLHNIRHNIVQFSNVLGHEFLDAYIGLIANQKLQTEVYVLSFLLKNRFYPGDLWELVGERSIEAKEEETLHAAVEHVLLEERRKQCQIEVSLYTQAIEVLEQHWLSSLMETLLPLHIPLSLVHGNSTLQEERLTSVCLNCIGSLLLLSSTWVTADVQKSFYKLFKQELTIQGELMVTSLATRHSNAYLCNLELDLLILQAKRRCAHAEIALYTMAISNLYGHNLCDISSSTSSDSNIVRPLCNEVHYHNEDINSSTEESCEDYEDYKDYKDNKDHVKLDIQ
ncbi:uncharacterized protein F5891DRAFT_985162 [Suillus fuscotomentosus]|uniref:Uncharacterized protein n=1 Tax=Suillus fuscotomentosus TaxID=1912939 RepID=A0AAD4DWQ1_9AGAM|nr:uncharacterized protein F5891DRAFT_985162 [Suillus fuscotomentosus]KAG1894274.1 hypothetical protein F5891DRAFT_985162 [Suillus fuscotomentosus]